MDIKAIKDKFNSLFGNELNLYTSPGRVNLIGEHTDYNGGFVFPGAIDKGIFAAINPNGTDKIRTLDVDQVIVAVGVSPNPLVPKSIPGLELGRKNTIAVSEEMQSSRSEIFAGGDIVRGGATVILAMGDGRRAALNMDEFLQKK